jgi:hypothetical protein
MAFKQFTDLGSRPNRSETPSISIEKKGSFRINAAAVREFDLEKNNYAELYFDESKNVVGIKPVSKQGDQTAKISIFYDKKKDKFVYAQISCMAFVRHIGIDLGSTTRRELTKDKNGILTFSLNGE